MPKTPAKVTQPPHADRRAQILDATVELLLKNGLTATRTRDVTERSGVGTGLLNHYFRWSELRATAWTLIFEQVVRVTFTSSLPPNEAMERFLKTSFKPSSEKYWLLWIEATELAKKDTAMAKAIAEAQLATEQGLGGILRAGSEAGHWAVRDPDSTATRLSALHDGLAGMLLSGAVGLDRKKAETHLRKVFAMECGDRGK
jgi:AcrR family transcriptional regulator